MTHTMTEKEEKRERFVRAMTILDQMARATQEGQGYGRLTALLGARQITPTDSGVSFRYGKGRRYIEVSLDEVTDTYVVEFLEFGNYWRVKSHDVLRDVYAEDLAPVVTARTGLDTYL